jgi:hypothetical protein
MHRSFTRIAFVLTGWACLVGLFMAATPASAKVLNVMLFDMNPTQSVIVTNNGNEITTAATSSQGSTIVPVLASVGDRIGFLENGTVLPQPPSPPTFVNASENGSSCIDISWLGSSDPDIVGYVVDYGDQSGIGAGQYEFSVDAGPATFHELCNTGSGTFYLAVRSKNYLGMMSQFSTEVAVSITVTPVFITRFDVSSDDYGVRLDWDVWSDEGLQGFRLYREHVTRGLTEVVSGGLLTIDRTGFLDDDVEPGMEYRYTLAVVKDDGTEVVSQPRIITTRALSLSLDQNVPNPFNPTTRIRFVVPESGQVTLTVFDVRGSVVATLVRSSMSAGPATVTWDGSDRFGQTAASGTYFYRLDVAGRSLSKKMLLLK